MFLNHSQLFKFEMVLIFYRFALFWYDVIQKICAKIRARGTGQLINDTKSALSPHVVTAKFDGSQAPIVTNVTTRRILLDCAALFNKSFLMIKIFKTKINISIDKNANNQISQAIFISQQLLCFDFFCHYTGRSDLKINTRGRNWPLKLTRIFCLAP